MDIERHQATLAGRGAIGSQQGWPRNRRDDLALEFPAEETGSIVREEDRDVAVMFEHRISALIPTERRQRRGSGRVGNLE
jgi:hypothetical protein